MRSSPFGGQARTQVLVALRLLDESYSRELSRVLNRSLTGVQMALRGLERDGLIAARTAGRTTYDRMRLVAVSLTGILSFSKIPLRLATMLGFFISTLSLAYGVWLIGRFFVAGHMPPGYTSLIVMMLFLGGLQLTVLGILGEYMGSVFDEVKHRPLYIVDEVIRHADTP